MFLRPHDYTNNVRSEEFERLKPSDKDLEGAYQAALEDAKSQLRYRFDVEQIFISIPAWDPAETYNAGDPVSLEAPQFDPTVQYSAGKLARYGDHVYKTTGQSYGEDPESSQNWEKAGEADRIYVSKSDGNTADPDDGQSWDQKDPRPANIRLKLVDCVLYHLYSFTQPRNIPEFRIQRKKDAEAFFEGLRNGKVQMDLPEAHPGTTQDDNVRFGGKRRHRF